MALGIIGLLALAVCLVMVIVNKVRKKPVKYWLIGAPIALMYFIVGVTASPAPSAPTHPAPTRPPTRAPTLAPTLAPLQRAATTAATPDRISAMTASEKSYLSSIQISRLIRALTKLIELSENPDPTSFVWKLSVASEITTIQAIYSEGLALRPPSSMTNFHDEYIKALEHYNNSNILLTRGIDNLDRSLIRRAGTEMDAGNEHIKTVGTLIEGFLN